MGDHELRCRNGILFGILDDGVIEFKCRSSRCGARSGAVVIHRFSTQTGHLLETKVYKDPDPAYTRRKEAVGYGAR